MTRGARRALLAVGALVLLVGVAVWRAHAGADATIERHRRELAVDLALLAAVPRTRPALLEPGLPGNAYDVYAPVIAALTAPGAGGGAGFQFPKPGRYLEVLDAHRADLTRWDEALRMACEAPLPPVLGGPPVPALRSQATLDVVTLQRNGVGEWLAAGRSEDALAAALRVIVLGADVRRSLGVHASMGGMSNEARGREMLGIVLRDGMLSADALARAARVLDALDAHRASLGDRLLAEAPFARGARIAMAGGEKPSSSVRDPLRGWRWLWSRRIFYATALDEGEALRQRTLVAYGRPLSAWRSTCAEVLAMFENSEHPELSGWGVGSTEAWTVKMEARERMIGTLHRVAVAVARFVAERARAPASLADLVPAYLPSIPICPASGEPLRWSAAALRLWSIGGDGKDDGGSPALGDVDLDVSGDFVLEIRAPR